MNVTEILREAKQLLSDEKKWARSPRDLSGYNSKECCLTAICWANVGSPNTAMVARKIFRGAIDCEDIARWNDNPARTHAEVLAAFDRAIALAEKEERAS